MTCLVRLLVGKSSFPTGQERISRLWDAMKWRLVSWSPWHDAYVDKEGKVVVFRKG